MHSTNLSLNHIARWVDEDELICPGCFQHVRPEPPTGNSEINGEAGPGFCHRDGSELCPDSRGRVYGPVEIRR